MKHTKLWTLVTLAALFGVVLLRDGVQRALASDSESSTWGATDPAWSPDGARLAFSLFGSIWQVPGEGGQAEQLSTSAGYHAHPRWSPQGDRIAFISGNPPAGPLPNISGTVAILDLSTGRERELATPNRTAGTPAWSPDGGRIVCGLSVLDAGSMLHEISMADEKVRQIQFRMQRGPSGPWVDTAWNPKRPEVYFSARRNGPPQIWSMPGNGPRILVQMPLTRYRPGDIVLLHSLSALPDGSGVIYSADEVNGRGNFELYRIGRDGGRPSAITDSERDEFAPAVSPDGRRVACVSNRLGNIDLFTIPITGGEPKHVRIAGLKFRGQSGRVHVQVRDERSEPTPVRLFVRASDGKAYGPSGSPMYYFPLDPGGAREGFFVARGDDSFPVPAGSLRLIAVKGVEYRIAERSVDVAPGETTEVTISLERWTNWNQRGWYTGENHFHANYNGSYYQKPTDSLRWLEADDLNTANMIVANSEGAFIHDKEFFRGAVDPLSTRRYVLYWGEEYRNSDPLGHMGFLNLKKLVPPFFTSVIGSNSPYDFPLNTTAAMEARRQGGLTTYMHPIGGTLNDVFDTNLGAKESPITAALGALDAFDVLPYSGPAFDMWYSLLNSGFKISPGAGTDCFTNWRGINQVPGSAREYVEVGPAMNWDRWISRYREGRCFVTNGPLVTFDANGQAPGSVIQVSTGQPYHAKLTAEVTSRDALQRVEFIQNGKSIESRQVDSEARSFRMDKDVEVTTSSWFAVRVTGRPARAVGVPVAHSGAVYFHAGGQPVLVKDDIELMIRWVERSWAYLEERDKFGPGSNRPQARKMFDQALAHYRAKLEQGR